MPSFIETLGQQAASSGTQTGIGAIYGLALEGHNDRRQLKQQKKLQDLQIAGQKDLSAYNYGLQLDMWKNTSYPAQKELMQKAGLNPALMYGMSGGGGQTTGTPSGNVTGAEAPRGGGEQLAAMGISMQAAQLSLLKAQKENIEADTANKNADTSNKPLQGQNIQASTANLQATTQNVQAQKELTQVQTEIEQVKQYIAGKTQNMQISIIRSQMEAAAEQLEIIKNEHKLSDETLETQINIVKREYAIMAIQAAAIRKGIQLSDQQITNLKTDNYWKGIEGATNEGEYKIKRDEIIDNMSKETGVPSEIIGNILQLLIFKKILAPGAPAPVRGFHNR